MKYACIQQYFDNGKVKAFVQPVADDEKDKFISDMDKDLYIDVFDTKKQAEDFAKGARKE